MIWFEQSTVSLTAEIDLSQVQKPAAGRGWRVGEGEVCFCCSSRRNERESMNDSCARVVLREFRVKQM